MKPALWVFCGAVLGLLGVAAGALGAHGLADLLTRLGITGDELLRRERTFEVAVRYQVYHALALVLVGVLAAARPARAWTVAGVSFVLGVLIFSGCLYALVFSGVKVLGAIVPAGGVAFLVGWAALAAGAVQHGPYNHHDRAG